MEPLLALAALFELHRGAFSSLCQCHRPAAHSSDRPMFGGAEFVAP